MSSAVHPRHFHMSQTSPSPAASVPADWGSVGKKAELTIQTHKD